VAFVQRGTPLETITVASQDVQAFPEVLEVRFISEAEALAREAARAGRVRAAHRDLEANPLPASLEIRLKPEFRDARNAQAVAERLRGFPFVDDVRFGRDWIQRLDRLRNLAAIVGLVIGLAFAIVAIVIIGVTIRITVLQRATEISIMRLVGATNRYIREPFLLEGVIKGILGGLLRCHVLAGSRSSEERRRGPRRTGVFGTPNPAGLLLGTAIGLLGSLLSVGRHLRYV
jgi:cell division transport system permease protein